MLATRFALLLGAPGSGLPIAGYHTPDKILCSVSNLVQPAGGDQPYHPQAAIARFESERRRRPKSSLADEAVR
jgi:hypothetical protein